MLETLTPLGISLGIGLLVGLQREYSKSRLAGVRTFPLIAILGALTGLAGQAFGGWLVAAGLFSLVVAMTGANFLILHQEGERDSGLTTEIAVLVMFVLGAYSTIGEPWVVLAVGAVVAILLYLKTDLHGLVGRIGEKDMRAIMLLAAITFVILPVLPDEKYGPYGAWNPRHIWLIVVLVVGISIGGYVANKVWGGRRGTLAAGLLGGVISSTATTVSHARRSVDAPGFAGPSMLVIAIATCVSYVRVIAEIAVVAPSFLRSAALPLGCLVAVAVVATGVAWFVTVKDGDAVPAESNPTNLQSALVFAAVFAVVLAGVEGARHLLGERGIYAASAIGGLVDLDAITLSNSRVANDDPALAGTAWRGVLIAIMANLAFKAGVVAALGTRALFFRVLAVFAPQVVAAALLALFWPR